MAKYCVKCGKPLPDGVEICPDCNARTEAADAALFTRITAETEIWREEKTKPQRPKRTRSQKEKLAYAGAGVLVFAFLVFAILFTRPTSRVIRSVNQGEYDRAVEIYWSSEKLVNNGSQRIDNAILKRAQMLCDRFAANELSADETAAALSKLGSLGSGAETLLEEHIADFRALCRSQDHMAEAEKLFLNGEFLDARAEYLLVADGDGSYAQAQEKAAACLEQYAAQVVAAAGKSSAAGDYPAAIKALRTGSRTLDDFGTFSPDIDAALETCYADYEALLLDEAENLSSLQENDAAAELLRGGIEDFEMDSETMTAALENYLKLARADEIAFARARADEWYEDEEYEAAFDELDTLRDWLEGDPADIDAEIADLEAVFAEDMITQAEEIFAGDRQKLPEAVELLDNAIEIRPLEDMTVYRDNIAEYLPLNLEEADTAEKSGTVFRTKTTFESVDGTNYTDGWIWGENGAEISFRLDGQYDVFAADFAVRRADNKNANAHFELYCDGEKIFKSETLYHWQTVVIPVNVDISGCDELKIVFVNDYEVKTAENGYCYHGLCTPQVMKALPETEE